MGNRAAPRARKAKQAKQNTRRIPLHVNITRAPADQQLPSATSSVREHRRRGMRQGGSEGGGEAGRQAGRPGGKDSGSGGLTLLIAVDRSWHGRPSVDHQPSWIRRRGCATHTRTRCLTPLDPVLSRGEPTRSCHVRQIRCNGGGLGSRGRLSRNATKCDPRL